MKNETRIFEVGAPVIVWNGALAWNRKAIEKGKVVEVTESYVYVQIEGGEEEVFLHDSQEIFLANDEKDIENLNDLVDKEEDRYYEAFSNDY